MRQASPVLPLLALACLLGAACAAAGKAMHLQLINTIYLCVLRWNTLFSSVSLRTWPSIRAKGSNAAGIAGTFNDLDAYKELNKNLSLLTWCSRQTVLQAAIWACAAQQQQQEQA
jgi:hypothetical protein